MQGGSIRLFKIFGIEVFLHFTWFIIAAYQLTARQHGYASPIFAMYEYLALFGIVLLHEFGHALACRQTGGTADRIMLWPLGGIAFVRPPQRPGAQLWSIVAGPLVNVVLIPILFVTQIVAFQFGLVRSPDVHRLLVMVAFINGLLLVFNLLPIYPLDGGQILRSLLWFPFGRIRSLQVVAVLGFITIPIAVLIGIYTGFLSALWGGILGFFLFSQAVAGWQQAQALAAMEEAERLAPVEPERPPVL